MENRDQQNRFLQPIQDCDRSGEWNFRIFLKAKVIQASSQLNPDKDKKFKFAGQPLPHPNSYGQTNHLEQFRFGARGNLTLNFYLENCFGENAVISISQFGNNTPYFSTATSAPNYQ